MPKIPSTTQISEYKLRKALSAVLRKLGLLKEEGVSDEETLLALASAYVERKSKLEGKVIGKPKVVLPTVKRNKEAEFDLQAWQSTLVIPEGYTEADIPY